MQTSYSFGKEALPKLTDDIEIKDFYTISGSVFNESNGHFAWADVNAPEDGTVMYSVTFTVKNGDKGKLVITPAEGYENDMPTALIAEIIGEENGTDEKDISEDNETSDDETHGETSYPPNENKPDDNPNTGIAASSAAAVIAGATVLATVKRKKQ